MPTPVLRGLTSISLTSDHPERTVRFYSDVVGLPLVPVRTSDGAEAWTCATSGLRLTVHPSRAFGAAAYPAHPESNTTHLSFGIHEVDGFLSHLKRHGLAPIGEVRRAGAARVVQVRDPDGRIVQFDTPAE